MNDSMYHYSIVDTLGQKTFSFTSEKYMPIGGLVNGVMPVKKGDKVVYIDKEGNRVLDAQSYQVLNGVYGMYDGVTAYASEDGRFGVMSKDGTKLIRDKYDLLLPLKDGTFMAQRDGKVGVIDRNDNVLIGCTCENQKRADQRMPVFLSLPLKHRAVIVEPMLEAVDLSAWLGPEIREVCAGGESGPEARICEYDWILALRRQCDEKGVPFHFHQTGARFLKDGRLYNVPRRLQNRQAAKAGISTAAGDRALALSLREEGEQLELEGL